MKLIYRIALRLSLLLVPLIAIWAVVFYFTMVSEINDEADDALEDYSEVLILRLLGGEELPSRERGICNFPPRDKLSRCRSVHPRKKGDRARARACDYLSRQERGLA